VIDLTDAVAKRTAERKSFYRALGAVAASLVLFFGSMLIGSSSFTGEPSFTYVGPEDEVAASEAYQARPTRVNYISDDEQALIAGSMLLVGTPGMLATSSGLGLTSGLNDGR